MLPTRHVTKIEKAPPTGDRRTRYHWVCRCGQRSADPPYSSSSAARSEGLRHEHSANIGDRRAAALAQQPKFVPLPLDRPNLTARQQRLLATIRSVQPEAAYRLLAAIEAWHERELIFGGYVDHERADRRV